MRKFLLWGWVTLVSTSTMAASQCAKDAEALLSASLEEGVRIRNEMNSIEAQRNFWQWLFRQKVNAQEVVKRNRIVQLDHLLATGNYKAAADLVVETQLKAPTGITRTVRTIFRDVESSQILIQNHQLKIAKLEHLIAKFPEKAETLTKVLEGEKLALGKEEDIFASSYYYYMAIRRHLDEIVTTCVGVCKDTTVVMTRGLGLNDTLLKSSNWMELTNFKKRLAEAGIPESEFDEAFVAHFDPKKVDPSRLTFESIAKTGQNESVRKKILIKERRDQVNLSVKLFLSEPIVFKTVYGALGYIPGAGKYIKNADAMKKLFINVINANAANKHFYEITMLIRSPADLETKLIELRNYATIDPGFLDSFVRRTDTDTLRRTLVDEAKKKKYKGLYDGLASKIDDAATEQVKKTLGEISPIYRKSPFDYFIDTAAFVGIIYEAWNLSHGSNEKVPTEVSVAAAKSEITKHKDELVKVFKDRIQKDPEFREQAREVIDQTRQGNEDEAAPAQSDVDEGGAPSSFGATSGTHE